MNVKYNVTIIVARIPENAIPFFKNQRNIIWPLWQEFSEKNVLRECSALPRRDTLRYHDQTEELIRSMQVASDAGATTICITGSVQSELARICDIALVATADERKYKPEPMSARIAQLSVIDVLSVAVAMTRQESLFQTLQKTRKAAQKDKQYNLDGGPL